MGQEGNVPLKSAQLFFDVSEKVRKVLESYFHLETPLYFSYSHLVCRSAMEGTSGPHVQQQGVNPAQRQTHTNTQTSGNRFTLLWQKRNKNGDKNDNKGQTITYSIVGDRSIE